MGDKNWNKAKMFVFEFDGDLVAFDILRSRPQLINDLDKKILRQRGPIDEAESIQRLSKAFDASQVKHSLEKLESWELLIPEDDPLPVNSEEPIFPAITNLELNIAEDCNLRCAYCCVGQGGFGADQLEDRQRGFLDWETAKDAVDFLLKESQDAPELHIRFFGGEPLMNWDVIESCVLYSIEQTEKLDKKISFSIVTNGTLLNDNIIRFMREHDFWVQVSIDGTPEMHDAFRKNIDGTGSYAAATAHLPKLMDAFEPTMLNGRGTVTHFEPNMVESLEHLLKIGFASPEIRPVTGNNGDYSMTVEDYLKFNEGLSTLARRILNSDSNDAHKYISIFNTYIPMFMGGVVRRAPCAAGRNMVGISADGGVYPCTDFIGKEHAAIQLGHINSGLRNDVLHQFLEIVDVDNKPVCSKCWARYLCGGACASVQLSNQGGLEESAGLECIWIRHAIKLSIWLYVKLREEKPAVFLDLYGEGTQELFAPLAEVFAME